VIRLSSTSALDSREQHGFAVRAGRDAEVMFRRAKRHSRKVRFLRRAIPVLVVLILGSTAMVRYFDPMRVLTRLPLSSKGLVISGTKITMAAPKLSGYTNDSRRYEMTAQSAQQDVTKPNMIELTAVIARIEAADKSTMNLTAATGLYDRSSGMLTLHRDIRLVSDAGYDVRLDDAVINTETSEIVSNSPVEVRTQQMTVKSTKMEVVNGGEVIVFTGDVYMYVPASEPAAGRKPGGKP
jgi:lipopolysaccharide export system protein LptC